MPGRKACLMVYIETVCILVLSLHAQRSLSFSYGRSRVDELPPKNCSLLPERGICRASHTRYYYDELFDECYAFTYGGCGGNGNNFESKEECRMFCNVTPAEKICMGPNEVWKNCTWCECKETVCPGYDVEYTLYSDSFGECLCANGYKRELDTKECVKSSQCLAEEIEEEAEKTYEDGENEDRRGYEDEDEERRTENGQEDAKEEVDHQQKKKVQVNGTEGGEKGNEEEDTVNENAKKEEDDRQEQEGDEKKRDDNEEEKRSGERKEEEEYDDVNVWVVSTDSNNISAQDFGNVNCTR